MPDVGMAGPDDERTAADASATRAGVWRRALARRDFRSLLGAVAVSQTGDWLYSVALVVFVFDATHSIAWVGASVVARQAALMLFGAVGGALADRFDRRRWMIAINLGQAVILAAMAAVAALSGPAALMIGLAFGAAALSAGHHAALFATIPAIVGEDDLAAANAVVSTVEQTAFVAGPGLGAVVVAVSSTGPAFAIAAAMLGVAAWLIARLRDVSPGAGAGAGDERDEEDSVRARLVDGVHAITNPSAAVVIAMVVGALAAYGFEEVLYVAVSADRLGTGAGGVGVMRAAVAVGGIVASLIVAKIAGSERAVPFLAGAFVTSGLALAALAAITAPAVAYVALFVGGGAFLIFEVVAVTVLQRELDPKVMGSVFGILMTLGSTAALLGSVAAPVLADGLGLRVALVVGGAIPLVVCALVTPFLARLDLTAAARARELEPRLEVLAQLGVFDGAPVPSLERLAANVTEQPVAFGTVVVREGDAADAFFVAREGTFDVTVQRDGKAIKIDELGPDDWFGEAGLVARVPRTATVAARTDGIVWRIAGDDFLAALEQAPGLPDPLMALMAVRLARTRSAQPGSGG